MELVINPFLANLLLVKWGAGQDCNFALNWIKSKTSKLIVSPRVTRALSGLLKYDVVIHSKPNRRLDLINFWYYYVLLQCQCFSVINARFDKLKKMWPFQTDDDQSPLTFISPRDRLKIKMLFNRYRSFHYKEKTVEWKYPSRERWFYIETGWNWVTGLIIEEHFCLYCNEQYITVNSSKCQRPRQSLT